MKLHEGVRSATLLSLLDSLEEPLAIVDNKANGICYTNPAFEDVLDSSQHAKFLECVRNTASTSRLSSSSSSSGGASFKQASIVDYNGTRVRVAYEESIEGNPGHTHSAYSRKNSTSTLDDTSNSVKSDPEGGKGAEESLIYLPLLGKANNNVTTTKSTPTDQGLDPHSDLDTQLERSVWQCLLVCRLLNTRYAVRDEMLITSSASRFPADLTMWGCSGKVRFASRTLAEIFRIPDTSEDVNDILALPKGCVGYLPSGAEMRMEEYPLYRTVHEHAIVKGAEFRIRRADGSFGSIRSTSSPIFDQNQEVVAIVAIIEDVSSNYENKLERDHLRAEHEAIVRSNRLKDEFIGSLSHELRTPINGLLGLHELATKEENSEERERYFKQMLTLTERLKVVVDDLLSVSLDEGRLEPEIAPYSMQDMLSEVIQSLSNAARHKKIKLSIQPPINPKFPREILTDKREWKGIMHRLLDNAIKFSDQGSSVNISLELQEENGSDYVVIRVIDQGKGIENPSRIFEAFAQEPQAISKTNSTGLGLGLKYVHAAVTRLGGTVDCSSKLGKGSIFSVYFPLSLPAEAHKPAGIPPLQRNMREVLDRPDYMQAASESIPKTVESGAELAHILPKVSRTVSDQLNEIGEKPAVLIVEDDPVNAKILQKVFEKEGYPVTWAEDGKVGYEKCKAQPYHLVIMDLMMPVMDGFESTKLIRKLEMEEHRQPCYIVGFTASTASRAHDDCIAAGMQMVVTKPCSGKKLLAAVERFL